jgi:hypothetical protein
MLDVQSTKQFSAFSFLSQFKMFPFVGILQVRIILCEQIVVTNFYEYYETC